MREDRDYICYNLLMKVFRDNAYASIELNSALSRCLQTDKAYITKLFYGVLERSIYYDYVLRNFAAQKPQKAVAVIVKMGYYLLENMNMPPYAAVDNTVKLCKKVGKGGAAGFVNSALRSFGKSELPECGTPYYLSVKYSYPLWLCERLIGDYGYDFARDMLACEPDKRTHIRVNTAVISKEAFAAKYADMIGADGLEATPVGYYASHNSLSAVKSCDFVVQSASSVAAVYAYISGMPAIGNALDLCAAPGGKAVLLATLTHARVTACDIHPHRVELIKKYAAHCRQDIAAEVNDATVFRPEWENAFDIVVCDVPCSGTGVVGSKPDIMFNRSPGDIAELGTVQKAILHTASRYVKTGGRLCYSTCSVLKCENGDVAEDFLRRHDNFRRADITSPLGRAESGEIRIFPHLHNADGFYVTAFTKIAE